MLILIDGHERRPSWLQSLPPDAAVYDAAARLALDLKAEGRWLARCEWTPPKAKAAAAVKVLRGWTDPLAAAAAGVRDPLARLLELMDGLHKQAAEELRGVEPGEGKGFRELVETWGAVVDALESLAAMGEPHPAAEPVEAGLVQLTEAANRGDREGAALAVERLGRVADAMLAGLQPAAA